MSAALLSLVDQHGLLLRRDAVEAGFDDRTLARLVLRGSLVRIRQGAYALASIWRSSDPRARHALLSRAVMQQYAGSPVLLSHVSALLAWDGPDWGLDLADVHVVSRDGAGERTGARVVHHRSRLRVEDERVRRGMAVTGPARTALDVAAISARAPGIAVLDWVLHERLATRRDLEEELRRRERWPGSLSLRARVALADGRSESVGESRTRLLLHDFRLPPPVCQYEVRFPDGRLAGRSDFAWPEIGALAEFDGRSKYGRLRAVDESPEDVVWREKRREDLMRELTGWPMIRISWSDLEDPEGTAGRFARLLSRRPAA